MNNLLQTVRSLGPARLASMGAVAVGLIAFFIFIITRLSTPSMNLLYADLDLAESGEIVTRLDSMSIPYELRAEGAQIYVPGDQVTKVRMALASEGLPSGGSIGNEIFDESEGLGNSSFVQNINRVRALEGELSRTIGSIANVRSARVHLVLPQRELFTRDRQQPSASIALKMKGASRLDREQIAAIQHLIASAVPGLNPAQVSIVDDRGSLLARGYEDNVSGGLLADTAAERQIEFEQRIARQVEELLGRTIGMQGVRARVAAELDFDRVVKNSEIYDPDSQVVRSTQVVEERADSVDRDGGDNTVSVQGNIPELSGDADGGGAGSFNNQSRTEETVNYEISRVVKEEIRETGIVRRLSVAVLVDGTYTPNADGEQVYQPRSEQEISQMESLVKSAIGFDEDRGDRVEIVNMQFQRDTSEEVIEEAGVLGLDKDTIANLIEMVVFAIVGILALLLVVRPMVAKLFESVPMRAGTADYNPVTGNFLPAAAGAPPALTGPQGAAGSAAPAASAPAGEESKSGSSSNMALLEQQMGAANNEIEEMINIRQIEGKIKASSIKKVGEIIEKHPEEATTVIRNWLYEESGGS